MVKEQKKGEAGIASAYLTRGRALKKLQISLKDFRQLCILKGIYPRDPKRKKFGKDKTYYHVKDIQFLMHEPLLARFSELKIYLRKRKNSMARRDPTRVARLDSQRPDLNLDHLVRERYPTFADALRDLDDCLTMLHMYSALPSTGRSNPGESVQLTLRLVREWQSYVVKSHCLRKAFVSIKGIYYQADVQGETVTWLVPHKFAASTRVPDVDFRVMNTFLHFYQTLLKFVNFRLFHDIGLRPYVDPALDAADAGLTVIRFESMAEAARREQQQKEQREEQQRQRLLKLQGPGGKAAAQGKKEKEQLSRIQHKVDEVVRRGGGDDDEDQDGEKKDAAMGGDAAAQLDGDSAEFAALSGGDALQLPGAVSGDSAKVARLFRGLTFVLGRECPCESLELVIAAGGGSVRRRDDLSAEEAAQLPGFTHYVVDRPVLADGDPMSKLRCVQPQWVFDALNTCALLPLEPYAPGVVPPPHLSPFVDDEKEGYVPEQRMVLRRWGGEDVPEQASEGGGAAAESDEEDDVPADASSSSDEDDDDDVEGGDNEDGDDDDGSGEEEDDDEDDEEEEEQDEEEEEEDDDSSEEERPPVLPKKAPKQDKKSKAEEEREMAVMMMKNRDKKLYDRIQYGLKRKKDAADQLRAKAQALKEAEAAGEEEEEEEEERAPVRETRKRKAAAETSVAPVATKAKRTRK